jgi:hypothetical protein
MVDGERQGREGVMEVSGERRVEKCDEVVIFGDSKAIAPWAGRVGRVFEVYRGVADVRHLNSCEEKRYPGSVLFPFSRVETARLSTDQILPLELFQAFNKVYPITVRIAPGVEVPPTLLPLIARSLSLDLEEKRTMITKFEKLGQEQVDRLVSVFVDEGDRFAALTSVENRYQLKVISRKMLSSWVQLTFSLRGEFPIW